MASAFRLVAFASIFLSLEINSVSCESLYIITSSANPCPAPFLWDQCLTLQRFATNNPASQGSSVTLIMESGAHTLSSLFQLDNIQNFTMIPHAANSNPRITCSVSSGDSFWLFSISHIQIQGISFDSCTSTFGNGGVSVLFSEVSFVNTGLTVRSISNSVQFNGVNLTSCPYSLIETVQESTHIQLRDVFVTQRYALEIRKAAEVTVENYVMQGVTEQSLVILKSPSVTITQSEFFDNDVGDNRLGGGLYMEEVTAWVSDSVFHNNHAVSGSAIAIYDSTLTVDASTFTNNDANLKGCIYTRSTSNITVTSSVFTSNTAVYGGAINALPERMQITNCTFTANGKQTVHTSGAGVPSGGVVTIMNSTFQSNSGGDDGGGAVYSDRTGEYTIKNCSFNYNHVSGGKGGAIVMKQTPLTIRNCSFYGNSASMDGGAISTSGTLISKWNSFSHNVATDNGGGVNVDFSGYRDIEINMSHCYVGDNRAEMANGGAIHVESSNVAVNIDNCNIERNTALFGSGGAVYLEGDHSNISLFYNIFDNNSASACGVLDSSDINHHSIKFDQTWFTSNKATGTSKGGGVLCANTTSSVLLTDCYFRNNSASPNAGVLNVDDAEVRVERCSFVNNSATHNGGVVYTNVYPTTYSVRLSTFLINQAGGDGGVVYVGIIRSRVSVEKSSFGGNSAVNRGGMAAINGSQLVIDNQSNVYANNASLGSAISACGNSDVVVPGELLPSTNDGDCNLYGGNINRYNISEFIRQELISTTTSAPVTTAATTAVNITIRATTPPTDTIATEPEPESYDTSYTSHTDHPVDVWTIHEETEHEYTPSKGTAYTPSHRPPTPSIGSDTATGSSMSSSNTDYAKIAIAMASVSLVLTIGLCALAGVYIGVKVFFTVSKGTGSRKNNWSSENEFILQEDQA